MFQLEVLGGRMAGQKHLARHFPFYLGRGRACHLVLDEPGVWERHAEVVWEEEGLVLNIHPPALGTVNGQAVTRRVLRSGDVVELGSVPLRFSLGATRPRSLAMRETLTWMALGLLFIAQAALIFVLT